MEDNLNIEELILEGAIEVVGLDDKTGEFLYGFTNKLRDLYPEIYNEVQTHFSKEAMVLWQNGFLKMDITESNPIVSITPKALDQEEVDKLDPEIKSTLKEILRILFLDK